ncbi:thiol:disulfide interchange protein DsbG [Pseudomonas abieticivorans]|uniref:thiol:disulfide interchange protein DsbG n=1 Tax=Pseudomonas abieticivorans TaxID=2931382 RepID=UPI0020BEEE3E|nr:thiol:disulfide interchange protein DsbG [Pseudomonas sp. PIA16]
MKRLLLTLALCTPALHAAPLPAPIKALQDQGLTFHGEFDAPAGLKGYAAQYQQQGVAVYLTADGKNTLVGNLYDAQGKDLSAEPLDRLVFAEMDKANWQRLENSTWIADGKADAPRIVYVFSDPNCPYCTMFWNQARPWVDAGKVQLRHIMVGIIRADSAAKAAAMLTSKDPAAALQQHEKAGKQSTLTGLDKIPANVEDQLAANLDLMTDLGTPATPAIFYHNDKGRVQQQQGAPRMDLLESILGKHP